MNNIRIPFICLTLLATFFLWVTAYTHMVQAAPNAILTVNTLLDNENDGCGANNCTLREAISEAVAGDTIQFSATGTIDISGKGELVIDKDLTINGDSNITIDGDNSTRVFNVTGGAITFDNLTIANGNTQTTDCGGGAGRCGGGIMVQNSSVNITVTNSTFSGNSAEFGGGIFIYQGAVTITNSTLFGNSADDLGGGISNFQGTATITTSTISGNSADYGGGIRNSQATATITNSTISGNSANSDGGGIYTYRGALTLTNSTLSGNSANVYGGGINSNYLGAATITNSTISGNSAVYGGGIRHAEGTVTMTNSTLSNNLAELGGGIYNYKSTATISNSTLSGNMATDSGGGIFTISASGSCTAMPALTIRNSTLSGNNSTVSGGGIRNNNGVIAISYSTLTANTAPAGFGGGLFSYNDYNYTCTQVDSSIIVGNIGGDVAAEETSQRFASGGYNMVGTAGNNVNFAQEFNQIGDQTNVADAKLLALDNNGGSTQTHALDNGSPALEQIPYGTNGCGDTSTSDQRGQVRPGTRNQPTNQCEMGAWEAQVADPTAVTLQSLSATSTSNVLPVIMALLLLLGLSLIVLRRRSHLNYEG